MKHLWADPLNPSSGSDIGSLRVTFEIDTKTQKFIDEYPDQSIFIDLARIGGLWTFLAGIFTAIFGTSVLKVLFRECIQPMPGQILTSWIKIKPLSFIGSGKRVQEILVVLNIPKSFRTRRSHPKITILHIRTSTFSILKFSTRIKRVLNPLFNDKEISSNINVPI